jgi:hypothetical protein
MNMENVSIKTFLQWRRDEGKWNCAMLANYYWTLARYSPTVEYNRQGEKIKIKK